MSVRNRENPIIFRPAEVAAYAAACFMEYAWFDEEGFGDLIAAGDSNPIGVAAALQCAQQVAPDGPLFRMARYASHEVGTQAIDGLNRLSFRSADDSFYNIDDTNEMDDQLSMVGNRSSAIAKAAAINASTDRHGITATATPSVANIGAVAAADFTETDNLIINGQRIIGISTQINDADGTLVTAINAVSEQTGVTATHTEEGLLLSAEDGRNLEVIINGAAGPGLAPAAARIYRGGLILSSRRPIEIGGENGAVPGGGPDKSTGRSRLGITTAWH